jgi:hypothetical protein
MRPQPLAFTKRFPCSELPGRDRTWSWWLRPLPEVDLGVGDRNGERTAYSSTRGVTVARSDADDVDQIAEPVEVVGISSVERETVGMSGGGDQQVGDTPSM